MVQCIVRADGTLGSCSISAEDPSDMNFGDAALQLTRQFRMAPVTRDGTPVEGGRITIPVAFKLAPDATSTPPAAAIGPAPYAGFYSASHRVRVEGNWVEIEAYLKISRSGVMTAYALNGLPPSASSRSCSPTCKPPPPPCFEPARDQAVNAPLQGKTLKPGAAPGGQPDYEVTVGATTFGVISLAGSPTRWFVRNNARNNLVNVNGERNLVTTQDGAFSITGPPMSASLVRSIARRMCPGGAGA